MDDEGAAASMANKRPCCSPSPPSTATHSVLLPLPPHPPPDLDMDSLLDRLLRLSPSSSTSSPSALSLDVSFEKLLESKPSDFDQDMLIGRALSLGSALVETAMRCARKKASRHNAHVWALPPDLTIKVFSMLDTQSLCYAAATCSMFHKCALDPLCYVDIDLRTVVPKVNNAVVSTMIQRAGKVLRSLKLGMVPGRLTSYGSSQPLVYTIRNSVDASSFSWNDKRSRQGKETAILTRSCLNSLIGDNSAAGLLLRRLHLHNIDRMDSAAMCAALSACPSLIDLEIVGLHIELRQTLESVSTKCRLIERLSFESSKTGRDDSLKSSTCVDFVNNCPHLNSLALRGFKLHDYKVRILVKGFHKLKHVDFSTSYSITGSFLRNIGTNNCVIEVVILRDCMHLKEIEVSRFLTSIIAGDFKILRHIDISNKEGLASDGDWYERCYSPGTCIPLKQLSEARPEICLLADFPSEGSFLEIENMVDSDENSEISLPSELSSHSSDILFMSSSESSYNSDHGSGNEDGRNQGYVMYEESSDEVDFLAL